MSVSTITRDQLKQKMDRGDRVVLVDDVVLFRDSAALAEKLMMLDKNFDFVMLPSSPHAAIQKDYVARFILRKITEHFDRYLGRGPRPARATSSSQ